MYCGYSTATLASRAKPSLCHSRRLALLDDGGGDYFPLRGLSINPRFLLYGYYLRQSSLIYWSPLRSFLAGHDGHSYSRMSLLDDEPCSARVPARRGGSRDCCCCCCCSSQRNFRRDPYRENYGDRIWEDEADYDEFDRSRRYPKREVEIRSSDGEKMRSSRERKDRSCSICPSCGHGSKTSGGRNIGRELGKKANATARKVREGQKMEDDIGYDSSEESNYDVRLSNRKGRGKTKLISLSRQEKEEDRHFTEDEFNIRDSRRKSGNYSRISVADEDFNMDSKSKNVVDSRKVDKDKQFTSIKQHAVVDQQLVEKDNQEFDKRVQKGASWSVSSHRRDEGYNGRPHTIRRESREGFQKVVSDIHEDDTMMTSRSKKFADEMKVDMAVSSACTVKQHHQVDKRVVGQTEMRTGVSNEYHNEDQVASQSQSREGSQKFLRISEVHVENADRISSMENMVNTRKVNNEQSSTSTSKHHTAIDHQLVGSCETREHLQNLRRMEEAHSNNAQRTINEQRRREEVIVKNRDDKSMLVHIATDKRGQVNQQLIDKKEVDEQHENQFSGLYVRGSENASSSQSFQQSRKDDRVDYSTSTVNLVYQAEKLQNQSESQVTHQSYLQRESGRSSCISELPRKGTGRVSAPVINKSHKKDELDHRQYSSRRESVEDRSISEFSKTDIQRDSNLQKQSNTRIGSHEQNSSFLLVQAEPGILTGESSQPTDEEATFTGTLDGDSGSLHARVQQLDNQTHRDDTYVNKGDVLDSASRLERSSAMYVGEFVDKLKKETSSFKRSSGTQTEETESRGHQDKPMQSGTRVVMTREKDDKYTQETPRRSSSRSGMKGPSDEMWDFRSPISQEDNRTAEMRGDGMSAGVVDSTIGTPTAETTISRRNPKSLWAHIADIIRMGWVHRAESHTSTRKSGKKSSSEGSEAWFSGQDASDNENDINGKSRTLKEILPIGAPIDQGQETHSSITQGSLLEAPGIAVMEIGGGASTSKGISGGNVLVGASVDTRLEDIELAKNESEPENIISSTTSFDQPPPLTGDTSSVALNEIIAYTGNLPEPVSGYARLEADLKIEEPSDVNKSPEKDAEIKRRKLQRNKQVLKETFEDWEEAYRLDSEQRKIDELFMREALVEAQKAADIWEVPVGAVLVHNGKIIARGFNLVEEKRDSTAHAEMICIREASDFLRTWRLADTTLYVTLEPCPMCAGAILQARIDTVVWGAPNKLLGADGSWVRLFPGDGGSNSLDASSQTGGPVHPFHPNIQIRRGVLATECSDAMQQFFQLRRKKKKKQESPPPSCLPVPNHPIKLFTKMHNIFSITHCL